MLYECLTGSVPFPKDSDLAVLWAHVNERPPGLDTQPALTPVVKRALAKQPTDRYPTCSELVGAARAALPKPEPDPAAATTGSSPSSCFCLREGLRPGSRSASAVERAGRKRT